MKYPHGGDCMELTEDMKAILAFVDRFKIVSVPEIAFCTLIEDWRIEIDIADMADAGLIELSTNSDDSQIVISKSFVGV